MSDLQRAARDHLWMHFTRMGSYNGKEEIPMIVRGEGAWLIDSHGNRKLDCLSTLFSVNVGHGRTELAEAAAEQMRELEFCTLWSYAHPRAIQLASTLAQLAPGDINRAFFTSGGAEAVESAVKLARAYHYQRGEGKRIKIIARELSYHGTTMGALSLTGLPGLKVPFEPTMPGACHVPNTNLYRMPDGMKPEDYAEAIEHKILFEGPESVAAVILEPVQNAGGCFVPPDGYFQRVREICDKYGVLLISDETICAWGRLGEMFGSERLGYQPDIITTAKGLTSSYIPMGVMLASEKLYEPFRDNMLPHGFTFGGHPVASAVALRNIQIIEDEGLLENVRRREPEMKHALETLKKIPIVGDVRGMGMFWAVELVSDQETRAGFTPEQQNWLLRDFLSQELYKRGIICRADDRGDPVIQLAPPLIFTMEDIGYMQAILRSTLEDAWELLQSK
jgi:adenosylmethionine-8-amino-7-oxononanoate aminotransferase